MFRHLSKGNAISFMSDDRYYDRISRVSIDMNRDVTYKYSNRSCDDAGVCTMFPLVMS